MKAATDSAKISAIKNLLVKRYPPHIFALTVAAIIAPEHAAVVIPEILDKARRETDLPPLGLVAGGVQ